MTEATVAKLGVSPGQKGKKVGLYHLALCSHHAATRRCFNQILSGRRLFPMGLDGAHCDRSKSMIRRGNGGL